MEDVQPRFIPDMSRYNEILINDENPINDINFVQTQRAEVASLLGSNVALNENYELPFEGSIDEAFSNWIPKGIQSTDEYMTYIDFLENSKDK